MSLEEQIAQTVDPTEFTRLCNGIFAAEYGHDYQPIDGTRGDEGNDGWLESERRIFAIFCPLKPERRTDADYRTKALSDLEKAHKLRETGRLPVERWTFVTPRKQSNDVIVAIRKRGEELGIQANHVESTHLSGLFLKHPQLMKEFPQYHISKLEELLTKALESPAAREPKAGGDSGIHLFSYISIREAAKKDKELAEVVELRESKDRIAAKRALRALVYRSTNPLVQLNAVLGLLDLFSPLEDNLSDLASMCDLARDAARRLGSKASEALMLAHKGYYQSFEFGMLMVERFANAMTEQMIGLSLEDPRVAADRQRRLEQLSKGYAEAFKGAIELAQASQSGQGIAAVLISIGNAAGQRAMTWMRIGSKSAADHDRDMCKRSLLAAKDIYAALQDEHGIANAQFNLANQLRFLGEVEEAKELVKSVVPIAEKCGDADLSKKAGWLEETLRTGRIPNYLVGERRE